MSLLNHTWESSSQILPPAFSLYFSSFLPKVIQNCVTVPVQIRTTTANDVKVVAYLCVLRLEKFLSAVRTQKKVKQHEKFKSSLLPKKSLERFWCAGAVTNFHDTWYFRFHSGRCKEGFHQDYKGTNYQGIPKHKGLKFQLLTVDQNLNQGMC